MKVNVFAFKSNTELVYSLYVEAGIKKTKLLSSSCILKQIIRF